MNILTPLLFILISLSFQNPLMAQESAPARVRTVSLSDAAFLPEFEAPAHVLGDQDSQLTAEVSGLVKNILVDVGDSVRKGQTLVELDCREAKLRHRGATAEMDVLKAQLTLSRDQLERAEALRKEETISDDAYSRQHNEVAVLEARQRVQEATVDQASLQVKRCLLIAPFSGVIAERSAQLGEWTQPGSPLFRLVAIDSTQVSAQTSASITEQLIAGSEITFVWGDKELPVAIRHVLPIIDAASRSREVRLSDAIRAVPVQCSPLWSNVRSLYIYKNVKANAHSFRYSSSFRHRVSGRFSTTGKGDGYL